jgi:hypothetical protein
MSLSLSSYFYIRGIFENVQKHLTLEKANVIYSCRHKMLKDHLYFFHSCFILQFIEFFGE